MIADLETLLLDFTDVLPGHEISLVIHPFMSDEEGRSQAEFLQQRGNKGSMGLYGVIEGEHDEFFGNWFYRSCRNCWRTTEEQARNPHEQEQLGELALYSRH